jgi:hypothetical protein
MKRQDPESSRCWSEREQRLIDKLFKLGLILVAAIIFYEVFWGVGSW